jgi:hypothetical protein
MNTINYKGHEYTPEDIKAMREWILDCQWEDVDEDNIDELSDIQVLRGVDKHVYGGLAEFMSTML